jgi:hypothetical protein
MSLEQNNREACLRFQELYQQSLGRHVGMNIPPPVVGEDVMHYRARMCNLIKREFLPQKHDCWQSYHKMARTDSGIFTEFEKMLLPAAKAEAYNPANVPAGELRKREVRDEFGHLQEIRFVGPECFVKQMGRPGRRVLKFMAPRAEQVWP